MSGDIASYFLNLITLREHTLISGCLNDTYLKAHAKPEKLRPSRDKTGI
jgi:hypothetical protein